MLPTSEELTKLLDSRNQHGSVQTLEARPDEPPRLRMSPALGFELAAEVLRLRALNAELSANNRLLLAQTAATNDPRPAAQLRRWRESLRQVDNPPKLATWDMDADEYGPKGDLVTADYSPLAQFFFESNGKKCVVSLVNVETGIVAATNTVDPDADGGPGHAIRQCEEWAVAAGYQVVTE